MPSMDRSNMQAHAPKDESAPICLRPLHPGDAEAIFAMIDADRKRLAAWLPWVQDTQSAADTRHFIKEALARQAAQNGFELLIMHGGQTAGLIGLHEIKWEKLKTSIGYWLAGPSEGKGIMSAALNFLVDHCFQHLKLNRVVLNIAVHNLRSQALAERCGFHKLRILNNAEMLNGRFYDQYHYIRDRADPVFLNKQTKASGTLPSWS